MNDIQKVSIVVPVFNEEGNVEPLVGEIAAAMNPLDTDWELWLVDDGSTDASLDRIRGLCGREPHAGFLSFHRNRGQSAAFGAGFEAATGDVIVTLDADLQNDPADIPTLLDVYRQDADMVIGWRVNRRDDSRRRLASRLGNAVRNALTAETVHDTGCSLKVMRASLARRLPMFRGMHRFLPTLMKMYGARVVEVPVNHRPRHSGVSKYGAFSRGLEASQDLLAVNWMLRRYRPGEVSERRDPHA
ncbi:MAG: glycosyltransferase family 2 protein [Desulfovibrionaceae bacterium]|nr:glycosyltransferase family 2 protein [Desulfovibrionaceae bacterium]